MAKLPEIIITWDGEKLVVNPDVHRDLEIEVEMIRGQLRSVSRQRDIAFARLEDLVYGRRTLDSMKAELTDLLSLPF